MAEVDIPPEAMKPRRVNPATILLGMVIVSLGIGLVLFGLRQSEEKMTDLQRIETQKNIFVLPEKEQIPHWRKWAGDKSADPTLRAESLTQLALLGDTEGAKIAVAALTDPNHGLRGTCAQVLAHYGPGAAGDSAKPALLVALKDANTTDRRQILWALVELEESSIFDAAMESYKIGEVTTVQRLEGGIAFDPIKITRLVSLDELAKKASDDSAAVRQLVATILSENADPKWIDPLVKLVKDKEVVVAREAAPGLGKIADDRARQPLLDALKNADADSRDKFIDALRDGIGGAGLVLAFESVNTENEQKEWFQRRQLFDKLHKLADPRAGDAIVAWVEKTKPHKHWETEAGIALAEIGDVRGAKYIGLRMGIENADIYEKEKFWQADAGGHLTKTDRPRVVGARMLADLSMVLPQEQHAQLLEYAEQPVIKWLTDKIQPHANGLRFLAAVGSKDGKKLIRAWAFPDDALPVEGAQPPFPRAYETAQSALRYIGWMKDSRGKLIDQFDRKKDKKMDITQAGLEGAGLAMIGMALRAVTYGASNGLAQWGQTKDDRAETAMMEFIEDQTWHEEARLAACGGLAWIASDETLAKVVEQVGKFAASAEPKEQFIGSCYARTLTRRPIPAAVDMMIDLMRPELETGVRNALGHAIGVTGFAEGSPAEKKLFDMLGDPELRVAASLALVLGGTRSTAARTVATYADKEAAPALNTLKDLYFRAFGYWSDADLDRGNIYRWVENAEAISRVKLGDAPQEWARQRLQAQFDNLVFDNGPHSETRVVLRARLLKAARTGDAKERIGAIVTLKFMKEQGSLLALRDEEGDTGKMARKAYHELMNPRLVAGENLSHLKD